MQERERVRYDTPDLAGRRTRCPNRKTLRCNNGNNTLKRKGEKSFESRRGNRVAYFRRPINQVIRFLNGTDVRPSICPEKETEFAETGSLLASERQSSNEQFFRHA